MSVEKAPDIPRNPDGSFKKGHSGNPAGRPKGSKNAITLLRREVELALRQRTSQSMQDIVDKAIEMALEGHPGMIKLLLDHHLSKASEDEGPAKERLSININTESIGVEKDVTPQKNQTTIEDAQYHEEL